MATNTSYQFHLVMQRMLFSQLMCNAAQINIFYNSVCSLGIVVIPVTDPVTVTDDE